MTLAEIVPMLAAWTPYLAVGFLINIGISLLTMVIGTPLGYLLARGRLRGSRVAALLTAAARVPPTFVLIYYLAYVVPPGIEIGGHLLPLPDWLKASVALAVAVTGFVSDNALSALRHLERGERVEALYFIPAWTTYLLIIIMASSTASVIGVPEIVQRANTVIAAVGDPGAILWIYLYTMLWFLVLCWPLARLMRYAKLSLSRRAGSAAGTRIALEEQTALAEENLLTLPEGEDPVSGEPILDLVLDLPVSNDSIAAIQAGVEEAGEGALDQAAVFRLSLAVEELVTNVVKYGGVAGGRLAVAIYRRPDDVTVELGYGGAAFDPFRDAPAPDLDAPVESRPIGGLGVHLVTEMIDRAYYRRQGERNVLRLVMLRPGRDQRRGGVVTLTRRLVIMVASCIAFAIIVVSLVFGLLARNALIAQAEGQAQVVARIIAESARLSEVALEEAQNVLTDVLTTLALTADHVEQTSARDASDRFAEIVARGNLESIWLIDSDLHVLASSVGDYDSVIRGESLPDHLSRDALVALVSGRKYSVDFGPAVDGIRYVGVRAGPGRALIVGQPVSVLDAVRAANSVPVLMEAMLDRDDIISIEVLDDQQKSLAQVGDDRVPPELVKLAVNAVATGKPHSELRSRHLWVSAPVRDTAGIVIGAVVIEMSNQRLDRLLANLLVFGLGAAALVFGVGTAIAALSARRIAEPVSEVTTAAYAMEMRSFAPADLDPISRRKDEIGTLARVFQDMATRVQQREEDLEAEVRARTLELEQKNALLEASARRVEAELQAAKTLQAAMLPASLPASPAYSGTAAMVPAREMGGDFYDFFALDERRLGLVIADVSGKGVPAAFFMAISRTVLQSSALDGGSAGSCLARANAVLCARNPMELFVTAFYGILDVETGDFTYANGGHNPPLMVRRADGGVAGLPRTGGMALGVMPGITYGEKTARLGAGDTLFLYTDGISEAMDGEGREFGEARIEATLRETAEHPVDSVLLAVTGAVNTFVAGAPQSDDITCLVVRYLGPPERAAVTPQPMPA